MEKYNTVEVLESPMSVSDAWSELNRDYNISNYFLNFSPNANYSFRLLGPFVSTERLFTPSQIKRSVSEDVIKGTMKMKRSSFVEGIRQIKESANEKRIPISADLFKACLKNYESAKSAISNAASLARNRNQNPRLGEHLNLKQFEEMAHFLAKLYYRTGWQKVIMSNAFVYNNNVENTPRVRVVSFSKFSCTSLIVAARTVSSSRQEVEGLKISGLFAHDINLVKTGSGYNTQYNINLSPEPTHVGVPQTKHIFNEGLVDIKSLLRDVNNKSKITYIYRSPPDYRMDESIMENIMKEASDVIQNQPDSLQVEHGAAIERQINNLPMEAFENRPNPNDPINVLEV